MSLEPTGKTPQDAASSLISQIAGVGQGTSCTRAEANPTLGGLDQNTGPGWGSAAGQL